MNDSRHSTLCVYSVISRQDSGEEWLSIGQAVPHQDGRGFDVILRALPLNSKLVLRDSVPAEQQPSEDHSAVGGARSLKEHVDAFERTLIEHHLLETGGKISAVMERLDVPRRTLSEKIARLGINRLRLIHRATNDSPQSPENPTASDADRHATATNGSSSTLRHHDPAARIQDDAASYRRSDSR